MIEKCPLCLNKEQFKMREGHDNEAEGETDSFSVVQHIIYECQKCRQCEVAVFVYMLKK